MWKPTLTRHVDSGVPGYPCYPHIADSSQQSCKASADSELLESAEDLLQARYRRFVNLLGAKRCQKDGWKWLLSIICQNYMIMMIDSTLVSLLLAKVGHGQIRFHPLEGLLGWWVKIRTVHSPRHRNVEDLTWLWIYIYYNIYTYVYLQEMKVTEPWTRFEPLSLV